MNPLGHGRRLKREIWCLMSTTKVLTASFTHLMTSVGMLETRGSRHGALGGKLLTLAEPVRGWRGGGKAVVLELVCGASKGEFKVALPVLGVPTRGSSGKGYCPS